MQDAEPNVQAEVITWLEDAASHPGSGGEIRRIETHGALVFIAGDDVYKIKRAVRYPYMDLSTLELRRRACAQEVAINRGFAPAIYLGLVPITREDDGRLAFAGSGAPVEWAVHMRRFEDACLLGNVAREGPLSPARSVAVADTIWESHRLAPPSRVPDASRNVEAVAAEIAAGLGELDPTGAQARAFAALSRAQLDRVRDLLDRRGQAGFVRRCHGDLHLDNIVLWDGVPTLFDALEFDEKLATVDTLYDLAFLLMDLAIRGQDGAASTILNRYLWRSDAPLDLEGLAALPLFLALRAGIRAMVLEERAALQRTGDAAKAEASHALARAYLASALRFLEPPPPRLVAVGGLSGTGKSTLAMGLAPRLGAYPGAVVLRSDLERKSLLGAAETERLPQSAYAPSVTAEVYRRLRDKARLVLRAGHTAIIDAVHAKPGEREGSAAVARDLAIPFDGIWLSSPPEVMIARVEARRDDASDADADVVRHQLARPVGAVDWHPIEAGDDRAHVLARALAVLKAA